MLILPNPPPEYGLKSPLALVFGPVGLDGVGNGRRTVSNAVEVETSEAVLQNQIFSLFLAHLLECRFRIRGNGKRQSKDSYPLRSVLHRFNATSNKTCSGKKLERIF